MWHFTAKSHRRPYWEVSCSGKYFTGPVLPLWTRAFSMRGHFRSRDKDGGHTIPSSISRNPILQTSLLCILWNRSYCRSNFYIAGIEIFDLFCSCDLDLDPMTFVYEFDSYALELYWMCKNEFRTSRLSKVVVWQTDTTGIIYDAASWVHVNEAAFTRA